MNSLKKIFIGLAKIVVRHATNKSDREDDLHARAKLESITHEPYHYRRVSVGDSWTKREADTGIDRGWEALAIPDYLRFGVSGSTAQQWAADYNGMLTRALSACSRGDMVIISLVGNDIRHAARDGFVTGLEVYHATKYLSRVVTAFQEKEARVCLLLYTDPYNGHNLMARAGVGMMNIIVRGVASLYCCDLLDTEAILKPQHFTGFDFHPTSAGHEAIAQEIIRRYP